VPSLRVVVLLALVLIHGGDLVRPTDERIVATAGVNHVADEMLLTVVSGQYRDFGRGIAHQTHVRVDCYNILGLSKILFGLQAD